MTKLLKLFAVCLVTFLVFSTPAWASGSPFQDSIEGGIDNRPYIYGQFDCTRIYGTPYVLAEAKLYLNPGPLFPQYSAQGRLEGAKTREIPPNRWMFKHRMWVQEVVLTTNRAFMVTLANLGYYMHTAAILEIPLIAAPIRLGFDSAAQGNNSINREVFQQNRWNSIYQDGQFNVASFVTCPHQWDKKKSIPRKQIDRPVFSELIKSSPLAQFVLPLPLGHTIKFPTSPPTMQSPGMKVPVLR